MSEDIVEQLMRRAAEHRDTLENREDPQRAVLVEEAAKRIKLAREEYRLLQYLLDPVARASAANKGLKEALGL